MFASLKGDRSTAQEKLLCTSAHTQVHSLFLHFHNPMGRGWLSNTTGRDLAQEGRLYVLSATQWLGYDRKFRIPD